VIGEILPATAVAVDVRGERPEAELFPEEEAIVGRAVEKRRREFTTGRACAREALAGLGIPPGPIATGGRGEPVWPADVVGSITHCDGYRACAVARTTDLLTLGIDAEPNEPLPEGLLGDVARPEERPNLAELARAEPGIHWDRLLFSAKESVYKAWFPLTGAWLGFEDARLEIDPRTGSFAARLLVRGPSVRGVVLEGFRGRWLVQDGLVATAIALHA
jgi:4'-phosphopantetheinyl transferase EntD